MTRTGYEILGFAVWHGAKWYARRRVRSAVGGRRGVALGLAGAALVTALAVEGARRSS
ncbi:hypothetical protein [Conexibacter sp. SYSU D00693]|uniref:hypothetical protein n=1 Tax=Conexibacter sp. SYSU D00693 TaxID=2812560 RepID=UPI00196AFC84|nr:hypothetical protein [Conexibacter sp. SYSU D00693]